jgi:hypothetical protein
MGSGLASHAPWGPAPVESRGHPVREGGRRLDSAAMRKTLRTALWATLVDLVVLAIGSLKPSTIQGLVARALVGLVVAWVVLEVVQSRWFRTRLPFDVRSPFTPKAGKPIRPKPVPAVVELGFLDHEQNMKNAGALVTTNLAKVGDELLRGGKVMEARAPKITASAALSVEERLRATKKAAGEFEEHAKRLERAEIAVHANRVKLVDSLLGLIRTLPLQATYDWPALSKSLLTMVDASAVGKASTLAYRQATARSRSIAVSQEVNRSLDHVIAVLDRVLEDIEAILQCCAEGRELIAQRTTTHRSEAPRSARSSTGGRPPRQPSRGSSGKG